MKTSTYFETLAKRWNSNGRLRQDLVEGLPLLALSCWTVSIGANADGVSDTLRDFLQASLEAQPTGWYNQKLRERTLCEWCNERYRLENLMVCTICSCTYCGGCRIRVPKHENGNIACTCGGELVG